MSDINHVKFILKITYFHEDKSFFGKEIYSSVQSKVILITQHNHQHHTISCKFQKYISGHLLPLKLNIFFLTVIS